MVRAKRAALHSIGKSFIRRWPSHDTAIHSTFSMPPAVARRSDAGMIEEGWYVVTDDYVHLSDRGGNKVHGEFVGSAYRQWRDCARGCCVDATGESAKQTGQTVHSPDALSKNWLALRY